MLNISHRRFNQLKHKLSAKQIFLIFSLFLTLIFPLAYASVEVKENIVFKTKTNNATFSMGTDLNFYKTKVNSSHLWMDQSYTDGYYTRYCIYVTSPNDVQLTVESWFATKDSSATLTIDSPLATNIYLKFFSPNLQSAFASGATYSWFSANKTLTMIANSDTSTTIKITTTVTETRETNITPENVDVTITNMEADNCIFTETEYYIFQAQYWDGNGYSDLDTMKIATTTVIDSNLLQVTFPIYLTNDVLDTLNVEIYMYCEDDRGASDGWDEMQTDYFNVLNLGGYATLQSSGDAGRIIKGDIFELYAQNNSWAYAEITYRKLQHVHMLFNIWQENQRSWDDWETDNITIEFGMDYFYNDAWISGWSVYLEQYEGWIASATMRLRWTVKWYYQDVEIWSSTINSFPLVNRSTDEGIPASTSFILDFWFNKANASTTVGGRLTSEWYAMRDSANPWLRWATGSDWGVDVGNVSQAMFFHDLEDSDGNVISCKQLEMMRVWCNLSQGANAHDVRHELRDYDLFDMTCAREEMMGINTPIFIATKTPDMPRGGFLNALGNIYRAAAFLISDNLGKGLLNFWNIFTGFMNAIASWVGIDNLWTILMDMINDLWQWAVDSFTYVALLLVSMFAFLSVSMLKIASFVNQVVQQWVDMITTTIAFLDGAYTSGIHVWNDLGMSWWLLLGAILYPIWLVYLWEEEGLDAVINHIKFIADMFYSAIHVFIIIAQNVVSFIQYIIEAIPIVE